jgi:hypothetical protein
MPVDLTDAKQIATGIYVVGDQVLTLDLRDFLVNVRARLPFDIVVTSGVRTASAQARALRTKLDGYPTAAAGIQALHDLYKRDDLIDELVANGLDQASMEATIKGQIDRGQLLSSHLSGRALDLRIRGYTPDELAALDAACRAEGGRTVHEKVPPHLHVEVGEYTDRRLPLPVPTTTSRTVSGPR